MRAALIRTFSEYIKKAVVLNTCGSQRTTEAAVYLSAKMTSGVVHQCKKP